MVFYCYYNNLFRKGLILAFFDSCSDINFQVIGMSC